MENFTCSDNDSIYFFSIVKGIETLVEMHSE